MYSNKFIEVLKQIEKNDTNYEIRYNLIFSAMYHAQLCCLKTYIRFDELSPNWPVFCIDLNEYGEVSWHMPTTSSMSFYQNPYSLQEKYNRLNKFIVNNSD